MNHSCELETGFLLDLYDVVENQNIIAPLQITDLQSVAEQDLQRDLESKYSLIDPLGRFLVF